MMALFSGILYSYFYILSDYMNDHIVAFLVLSSFIDSFFFVQVTYTVGRDPLFVKDIVAESSPLFSAPVIVSTLQMTD